MIERSNRYLEAGADMIFAEALHNADDWRRAKAEINGLLLANMTEFGKSNLLSAGELEALGASVVIYPVTTLRAAMKASRDMLAEIAATGTQRNAIGRMQTRHKLYDLLRYQDYNQYDQGLYNFML